MNRISVILLLLLTSMTPMMGQTAYLYVGDRWMDPDLPNTKTIVFPISFEGTRCIFDYRDRFNINLATGEWRE